MSKISLPSPSPVLKALRIKLHSWLQTSPDTTPKHDSQRYHYFRQHRAAANGYHHPPGRALFSSCPRPNLLLPAQAYSAAPDLQNQVNKGLVLALCGLTARFSRHPAVAMRIPYLAGETFVSKARRIISMEFDDPTIETVQSMILLIQHDFFGQRGKSQ